MKRMSIFNIISIVIVLYILIMVGIIANCILHDAYNVPIISGTIEIVSYLIIFIVINKFYNINIKQVNTTPIELKMVILFVVLGIFCAIAYIYIGQPYFFKKFYNQPIKLNQSSENIFDSYQNNYELIWDIFKVIKVIILVPIVEEILFRGLLFKGMSLKYNIFISAIFISFTFAILHSLTDVYYFLSTFMGGLFYTLILCYTGNLVYCIILHILHNTMNFAMSVIIAIYGNTFMLKQVDSAYMINPVLVIVSLIVLMVMVIYMLKKYISTVKG